MATGLPKTKWGGNIEKLLSNIEAGGSDFSFNRVWPEIDSKVENRLYYGDNLNALKHLLSDKSVCGQIKLIYIDPPFSTNSVFQTRSHENGYADLLRGNDYLEYLKVRLLLLRELLSDDGSIYVHLDDNMAFQAKILMDDIFGAKNFRNIIVRQKCRSKNFTKNSFGNIADYILFYTKTSSAIWNKPHEAWTEEKKLKEFPFIDLGNGRRHKRVPLHAPGERNGLTGQAWRGIKPPKGKHWQYVPEKLDELDKAGRIHWSKNGNPRKKVYFDESQGISVQDIWLDCLDIDNQNTRITGYPTEKNINLLKRIIKASSNVGDIVLDCFAGSGTTLAAADELNRLWVGVDIEKKAIETILRRFSHGTEKMGDYVKKNITSQPLLFGLKQARQINDFAIYADRGKENEIKSMIGDWNRFKPLDLGAINSTETAYKNISAKPDNLALSRTS